MIGSSSDINGRTLRLGVSIIALIAGGISAPAWAAETRTQDSTAQTNATAPSAGDTSQAAISNADGPEASATTTGDEIVVTGRRAALQAAEQRKKRSETIIDSVVADEAGKLPDNSITEVLQRVAGVSIVRFAALGDPDHFSVEGSGIQVRGLSGVASRLNGREIFSANNGRALLWGDVTPELMAAVDVYKAATADLIEGGTGGQIDLRTKLPFDYKADGPHMAATFEVSRGDLADKTDIAGSVLLTNRWTTGIGDIGILVDVASSRFTSHSDFFRMEPYFRTRLLGQTSDYFIPGGYDFGDEDFRRNRTGIYGALQWAPNDDLKFTQTFFQSRYKNRSSGHGAFVTSQSLGVVPATSTFDDNGGLLTSENVFVRDQATFLPNGGTIGSGGGAGVSRSNSMTRDLSTNFTWNPRQGPLAISGAYQRVKSTSKVDRNDIFRDVAFPTSFGLDLTGDFPEVTISQSAQAAFDNPASYFWAASMPHNERNRGKMSAVNLDAEYSFDDSFFRSVKVGGRWSKRTERDLNNGFNWSALGRGWNGAPQMTFANAAPGDVELYEFDNFFRGEADVPGNFLFPSLDLINRMDRNELHRAPPAAFCAGGLVWNCSAAGPAAQTGYGGPGYRAPGFVLPNDITDYRTTTRAGYALVRFGRDYAPGTVGLSGNVGARLVRLENASSGYFQQGATSFIRGGQVVNLAARDAVRSGGASFTRLLPALNFQVQPSEPVRIRLAYNITMDLPSFNALRASGSLGVATTPNPSQVPNGPNLPRIFTNYTTNSGNPTLKPAMSNNLDLSLEWYPKPGTTFHLAAFRKRITNLPIYSVTQQPVTVYFTGGTSEEALATATDAANAEKAAKVKGFEVGGRAFLDMLPGALRGIGVEANYTFIDSKNPGDLYRDIFGTVRSDAPLQGMSRHNYNLTFLYEMNPISARIAYSWRSKYLQSTNSNGTNPTYQFYAAPGAPAQATQIALPVYGSAYGTWDAGITYKVNQNVSLWLQGTNLTKATQRTLMGGYQNDQLYTRSWFQSDRRINLGASFAF